MLGWLCNFILGGTTLRVLALGLSLSNITDSSLIDSLWESPNVTSRLVVSQVCRA